MKIKLLMACFLGFASATAVAQKGELNNAQTEYDSYSVSSQQAQKIPLLKAKAKTSLVNAKASIDKASTNQKTATLPLTYALKSAIYAAEAVADSVQSSSAVYYTTASEALKQAIAVDSKNENKKLIADATRNLEQYQLNIGVAAYQNKHYSDAYKAFDEYRQFAPEDTTAIFYTGLAATNAGNTDPKYYPFAIKNYNKLLTTKYSKNADVYKDLSAIYLVSKDTANALRITTEGISKFPNNADLRKRQIEIGLQSGKQNEILSSVQNAISADPKNKLYYYYAALTYSQIADADESSWAKEKSASMQTTLHQKALDNYSKASEMDKKAIELDPNYFDANFNLGYVLERPAIDTYNAANKLPANKQKEYDLQMAKAVTQFNVAKPYLLKAVELNPKSSEALTNLLSYYRGIKDNANAAKIQAQINTLKANPQ